MNYVLSPVERLQLEKLGELRRQRTRTEMLVSILCGLVTGDSIIRVLSALGII